MKGDKERREDERKTWEKDVLSRKVIECVIKVHQALGPGFLESFYHKALLIELAEQGLALETERRVTVRYKNVVVGRHRLDIIVDGRLLLEV